MALRVLRYAASGRHAPMRSFHSSTPSWVRVGDAVPDLPVLVEKSPGNKVNLAEEFKKGDGLVIGVPGAFSGACSQQHIPSYMSHADIKSAGQVFVVSVNDAFVMKAWAEAMDPAQQTGFRFLGDPSASFTKALDLSFDGLAIFGGIRSKRYALVIKDGKIVRCHVEPDDTGTKDSMADQVLGA